MLIAEMLLLVTVNDKEPHIGNASAGHSCRMTPSAWLGLLGAPRGMGSFGAGPAFADLL